MAPYTVQIDSDGETSGPAALVLWGPEEFARSAEAEAQHLKTAAYHTAMAKKARAEANEQRRIQKILETPEEPELEEPPVPKKRPMREMIRLSRTEKALALALEDK